MANRFWWSRADRLPLGSRRETYHSIPLPDYYHIQLADSPRPSNYGSNYGAAAYRQNLRDIFNADAALPDVSHGNPPPPLQGQLTNTAPDTISSPPWVPLASVPNWTTTLPEFWTTADAPVAPFRRRAPPQNWSTVTAASSQETPPRSPEMTAPSPPQASPSIQPPRQNSVDFYHDNPHSTRAQSTPRLADASASRSNRTAAGASPVTSRNPPSGNRRTGSALHVRFQTLSTSANSPTPSRARRRGAAPSVSRREAAPDQRQAAHSAHHECFLCGVCPQHQPLLDALLAPSGGGGPLSPPDCKGSRPTLPTYKWSRTCAGTPAQSFSPFPESMTLQYTPAQLMCFPVGCTIPILLMTSTNR
ncbi:hypothetical protein K438DRAFT_1776281 [Mycena galopus ATCC 62051]|nr:hypothetical protein K438DRAFT_1776281 [Mycena galopus ATCC 62051]